MEPEEKNKRVNFWLDKSSGSIIAALFLAVKNWK